MLKKSIIFFCLISVMSCSIKYSFSGASISPDVKTCSISYINNQIASAPASISDVFTEGLKEKFRSNAGLSIVPKNGHIQFEGTITKYSVTYQGVKADQTPAQNRLEITVSIKYTNTIEPLKSFEKNFTRFEDFEVQDLRNVENSLIETISQQIIEEIFMAAVANW